MALNWDAGAQFPAIAAELTEDARLTAQCGVSRLEMKWAGGSGFKAAFSLFWTAGKTTEGWSHFSSLL